MVEGTANSRSMCEKVLDVGLVGWNCPSFLEILQ